MNIRSNIERYLKPQRLYLPKVFLMLFVMGSSLLFGQQSDPFRKDIKQLYPILFKHYPLTYQLSVKQNGIFIHASDGKGYISEEPEVGIYWNETRFFPYQIAQRKMHEALAYYQQKGTRKMDPLEMIDIITGGIPDDVSDLPLHNFKIALDPGHFAHNYRVAVYERKYIKLRASDMGTQKDIILYEAKLTALTAMVLKDMLKELGAEVMVTRDINTTATGKNYDDWYEEDFLNDLKEDLKNQMVDSAEYKYLMARRRMKYTILRKYFMRKEFRARADKINQFHPDLTLIMHYNVDENNNPDDDGYHKPHDQNFSMVFVGGSYARNELVKPVDRMLFLRQALSDDIEHSITFSSIVEDHIVSEMKVPAYTMDFPLTYIDKYSIAADQDKHPGIYHRNLYLTRAVYGTFAFTEPLLQDNRKEAIALSTYDCDWNGTPLPCRIVEMATAYKNAILEYYELLQKQNH